MKIITKIKKELNDVYGITSIGKTKFGAIVYIIAEEYRGMISSLLKKKLSQEEFEQVQIIVSGPVLPAED